MACELTERQDQLITGPMWSGQGGNRNPLDAQFNIAARSLSTVRKHLAVDEEGIQPVIQTKQLDALQKAVGSSGGRYWIALDATDCKVALQESKKGAKWDGDVNLGNGDFELLRLSYDTRRANFEDLTSEFSQDRLSCLLADMAADVVFLEEELTSARETYAKRLECQTTSSEILKAACWHVVECNVLLQKAQAFHQRFRTMEEVYFGANPPGGFGHAMSEV